MNFGRATKPYGNVLFIAFIAGFLVFTAVNARPAEAQTYTPPQNLTYQTGTINTINLKTLYQPEYTGTCTPQTTTNTRQTQNCIIQIQQTTDGTWTYNWIDTDGTQTLTYLTRTPSDLTPTALEKDQINTTWYTIYQNTFQHTPQFMTTIGAMLTLYLTVLLVKVAIRKIRNRLATTGTP